ncbi:hypothetical protein FRX31_003821 [Thalictrum thalictroides]|uniref:Uncharacterized protein n=1 Tax=Thalictrum thalictroides TaxID=46969 RepID=A0A7J6XAT9_THATH|nr:hypothetical protein FRX31_003821 [Thalictrum thalictroides]
MRSSIQSNMGGKGVVRAAISCIRLTFMFVSSFLQGAAKRNSVINEYKFSQCMVWEQLLSLSLLAHWTEGSSH